MPKLGSNFQTLSDLTPRSLYKRGYNALLGQCCLPALVRTDGGASPLEIASTNPPPFPSPSSSSTPSPAAIRREARVLAWFPPPRRRLGTRRLLSLPLRPQNPNFVSENSKKNLIYADRWVVHVRGCHAGQWRRGTGARVW